MISAARASSGAFGSPQTAYSPRDNATAHAPPIHSANTGCRRRRRLLTQLGTRRLVEMNEGEFLFENRRFLFPDPLDRGFPLQLPTPVREYGVQTLGIGTTRSTGNRHDGEDRKDAKRTRGKKYLHQGVSSMSRLARSRSASDGADTVRRRATRTTTWTAKRASSTGENQRNHVDGLNGGSYSTKSP